jgi:D-arabinose 1-dehydrogenase-like Zn-dependent alcohol dehydrogenase
MYCEKMVSSGLMVAGSYQQYVVSPSNYTSRIPDNVDDFIAGPIMCSGSTTYASVSLCCVSCTCLYFDSSFSPSWISLA